MMERGKFFVFEGIDFCGKGSQMKLLGEYLDEKGISKEFSREPGGTALGEALRKTLKRPDDVYEALNEKFRGNPDYLPSKKGELRTPEAEMLMFMAARSEFKDKIIRPRLDQGIHVIADRLWHSTLAYQGWGRFNGDSEKLEFIRQGHKVILGDYFPDRVFFLNITYEEMCKRKELDQVREDGDLFDSLEKEFFDKVIRGYLDESQIDDSIMNIDGTLPMEVIFNDYIKKEVDRMLGL